MNSEAWIGALAELVPPPERPGRPSAPDWDRFARENGFEAPADYRLLIERYGVGGFGAGGLPGGWLLLLDPFPDGTSFVELSAWDRRNSRGLQRQFPDQYPGWPMWPLAEGLLPWANTADGDLVGWWTVGGPDGWGTRFFGRSDEFEEFEIGAVEFIVRLLRGQLGARDLDGRFGTLEPDEALSFVPHAVVRRVPPPIEEVTIVFDGLAAVVDRGALPTHHDIPWGGSPDEVRAATETWGQRQEAAMRPAQAIIDAWIAEAETAGLRVRSVGTHSAGTGDPLHHEIGVAFDPAREADAKALVEDLARRLGVAIREVRNLEADRIWPELSGR